MIDSTTLRKIIKLTITHEGIVDKIHDAGITKDHFVDQNNSDESKILSRIYDLSQEYYISSGGSLLSGEVFNARVNDANIKDRIKSEIISQWLEVQKETVSTNDLHHLLEVVKQEHAAKLLDVSLSNLQNNLSEKGLKDSIVAMQTDLDKIYTQLAEVDTEKVIFDINLNPQVFIDEYLLRFVNKDSFSGITMGIPDIDQKTYGWKPGQLIVFLGPTSGGKSVQLLNAAIHANMVCKKNVMYFSFEMGSWDCQIRHVSNALNIEFEKLATQSLSETEMREMFQKVLVMNPDNYFEYDVNLDDPTPEYIEARIKEISHTKGKPDIIVVDYIGNMTTRDTARGAKAWEANGNAAVGLFRLAKKYNIPVITAQQINREAIRENRKNKNDGKASAYYQDATSGDQRLMHLAYFVIGIEPDKENNIVVYHPVKMRHSWFQPCVTMIDPSVNKILPLTTTDQQHWKVLKGLVKESEYTTVTTKPTKRSFVSSEDDDDIEQIPW